MGVTGCGENWILLWWAQTVKNLPVMQEIWVQSLEKGMVTHSSYSCLENPMDRGAWWATVHRVSKSQTQLSDFTSLHLISLQSKGLWRVFSNTTGQKHQFFGAQPSSQSNSHSHPFMTTGKTIALTKQTFVGKVMSLLLNMRSSLVITFLPRSKHLLISWLQSPSAVILEPKRIKSDTVSTCFSIYFPWSDGTGCHDLCFLNVEL